jgi:protein-disulfide isomerase
MSLNVPADGARVLVVKFNDYQCPACRETYMQYKSILAKYQAQYPGQVRFVTKDFPLEAECNAGSVHPSACEAAAAVRMAREKNKGEALEEWLFAHQEAMTPQMVKEGLKEVANVSDFDAQYPKILEEVRADAAMGRALDIKATPTFFVDGIKVQGGLRPMYFDALIAYELKKKQ